MSEQAGGHGLGALTHLVPDDATVRVLRDLAFDLAREAGELIVDERPDALGVADTKSSEVDVVTVMDRRSEELLRARIAAARPDDAILGEEDGASAGTSGLTWVIDPIDGTVNYLYGHPFYAVSVAVCVGDTAREGAWLPVAGAVAVPELDRTYVAGHGQGAEVVDRAGRRRPLAVSGCKRLELALVGTGFGYEADKRREQGQMLASLLPRVRDVRRAGAAAIDLCFVAEGILDAYYESGINAWDQAAGQVIATEAGALMSGMPGLPAGKTMAVASTPKIHEALRGCLFPAAR